MRSGVKGRARRSTSFAEPRLLATTLALGSLALGCIVEGEEPPRSPRPAQPLPSRLRVAVCEAVVAAARNGVRPSALEVALPVDGTEASVALRFEGAQLPEAHHCADLIPAAAMLPALPPPAARASTPLQAPTTAPTTAQPVRAEPEPYIPSYPARPSTPLDTRR